MPCLLGATVFLAANRKKWQLKQAVLSWNTTAKSHWFQAIQVVWLALPHSFSARALLFAMHLIHDLFIWRHATAALCKPQNHRMVWVGKDLKDHSAPTTSCGQGFFPLDQLSQIPVQSGLKHSEGWSIHSFSLQPIPASHQPHCKDDITRHSKDYMKSSSWKTLQDKSRFYLEW